MRERAHRLMGRLPHPLARVALTLAFLPWLVQPGVIEPDTKIDLVVSPWRYLGRSLDAWSSHSGFGELQNQAYGYLFPMGPFFGVLHSMGVPGWATQRAWWSLLLVVGFGGAALVARRVVGMSVLAASVVGVAYALSPRVLTLLSELSVEAWPGMLLPWFVLAVHRAQRTHRILRLVAEVGLLTVCVGGVNATASLVPVLGGGLYLVVVMRGRPRAPATVAYVAGAALGAAWWLGPLVVLGGYAYPFMDFIETSRITTAVTTLPAILRGASDWVAYIVDASGHPVWQSGWIVAQGAASIVAGSALAGVALVGLARRRRDAGQAVDAGGTRRQQAALSVMLAVGVLAMAAGYAGSPSGPQSGAARDLLDGPLAAARNVHKFDPLVRLPLVLGVGFVVDRLVRRRTRVTNSVSMPGAAWARSGALLGVTVLLLGTFAPLWSGRLADANGVVAWPSSVRDTARDIDARAARDGGSTLVLPSARTADYVWGTTGDEPLGAFAASPVAVRASAPLYHPGAQRLVDAIDSCLASGESVDAALAAAFRAGVRRIVVRWGLTPAQQTTSAQRYVTALNGSRLAHHHAVHGAGSRRDDVFDLVASGSSASRTSEAASPTAGIPALGGPESTITLASLGIRTPRPLMTGQTGGWVTDDVRRRVDNNGRPASLAFGPTLTADDPAPERLGARDLDFPGRAASLTVLTVTGAESIRADHSTSDPFARLYLGPGTSPSAAFDESPTTRWLTPLDHPSTLDITWKSGVPAQRMTLVPAAVGAHVTGVEVIADGRVVSARAARGTWVVGLPAGLHRVQVLPLGTAASKQAAVGFSSVTSTQPLTAVVTLPGRVDPAHDGVVMSRTHPWALGRPLASEDDGPWTRSIHVAAAGTMNVNWRVGETSARTADRALAWRVDGGPWQTVAQPATHSIPESLHLPRGTIEFRAGAAVEQVVLTPRTPAARSALGLPGAGGSLTQDGLGSHDGVTNQPSSHADLVTLASTQGANAGWHTASGRGTSVTLDGWRQGVLDGSPHDRLVFAPQDAHRLTLGVGAACILVLLALWALTQRSAPKNGAPTTHRHASPAEERTPRGATSARRMPQRSSVLAAVAVMTLAVVALGWVALPVAAVALAVPRRWRSIVIVGVMAAVGPIMAALGVVDKGSAGAWLGQTLTGLALLVFSAAMLDVPSGWRGVRSLSSSHEPGPHSPRR